jgi:DNA-directed RNA polymerase specialized sigma24 family protein
VEDAATDSEPPSGAALAVSLGRGESAGLLAVHDAYGPDLIGYAQFLLASRRAPAGAAAGADVHPADEAAEVVLDALLAATGAAADLTDPDRMRAWLLALTRNECLRRRPGTSAPATVEAAELGRRGLGPVDVAALLGFAPAALPSRVPAVETVPAWLRAELVAGAGPDGASRRAALTRRARPFDSDGFPVPLDRRRLSGKVLAWSAGAVVVVALALLVGLPANGNAGGGVGPEPAALAIAPSAASAAPVPASDDPIPTLAGGAFAAGAPVDGAVPAQPPATHPSRTTAPPPPVVAAPDRPDAQTADRSAGSSGALELSWSPAAGLACGGTWTAHLHVTTGGVDVAKVVAVSSRGGVVTLQRDGDGWSGDLTNLPTDRTVTVTVFAEGSVRRASARLGTDC